MNLHNRLLPADGPRLSRSDLLTYENLLRDEIRCFLPHDSYSIYFPRSLEGETMIELAQGRAVLLPEENKALLPLRLGDEFLGVFVAKNVAADTPDTLAPYLGGMAGMCVEKLQLYKISVTDGDTGLATRELLSRACASEVKQVRECIMPSSDKCLDSSDFNACFGMVAVRLKDMDTAADRFGPSFVTDTLSEIAAIAAEEAPDQALAARAGDDAIAVLLPGASLTTCRQLADRIAARTAEITIRDSILDRRVSPHTGVGFANYPQDMSGNGLRMGPQDQAGMLLSRALRAADRVESGRAFGFPQIVSEGGTVTNVLPLGRLMVNFGYAYGAREGQRFLIWSTDYAGASGQHAPPVCKGEVVLMEVKSDTALAEITYQADPGLNITPGDRLALVRDSEQPPESDDEPGTDRLTGLYTYRGFLRKFAAERTASERFCVILLRQSDAFQSQDATETKLRDLAGMCRELFGPESFGGRHSIGALVWFLPGTTPKKARTLCLRLAKQLGDDAPACGIAPFPFLSFSKADALPNAAKALEYALLLDPPHIGVADTLALNIHADKLFAQGHLYEAIEEYKLALVADPGNTMARNSLGVCHARSGNLSGAKRQFRTVLGKNGKDVFALYNYGYACQKSGDVKKAREAYKKCLSVDADHVFCLIRLSEMSRDSRRFADARRYLEKAAAMKNGEALTRRHLARLALAQDNTEEAREHLHQALVHDPKDAFSLHLMAQLYLDNGEDPEVAETLARQSAALMPASKTPRKILAEALEAQGRTEDAARVLDRMDE